MSVAKVEVISPPKEPTVVPTATGRSAAIVVSITNVPCG